MKKKDKQFGQFIFDNHNFDGTPDEFLEKTAPLIGYIVHSFNSLDERLNYMICELINSRTDEIGAIVICKFTFSSKIDLFYRLIRSMEITFNKKIECFELLITNLKKCANLRNAVIHAEWENMDENGFAYVKMYFNKNGLQQQYWQFTPESLIEIEDFINDTYFLFDKFDDEKNEIFFTDSN